MARARAIGVAVAAVLAIGGLSGCKTVENLAQEVAGRDTYEEFPGRFIAVAQERQTVSANDNIVTVLGEAVAGRQEGAEYSYGLGGKLKAVPLTPSSNKAGAEALEAYMVKILDRVLANWPHERPDMNVMLTDQPYYMAETTGDGTIAVAQGVFYHCESEDELAFILAHEASHVLMHHHEADRHNQAQQKLENFAAEGLAQVLSKEDPNDPNLRKKNMGAWLSVQAFRAAQTALLDPSWEREQEDEADLLALDLITAAGYNNTVYQTVLERMAATDDIRREREEQERKEIADRITGVFESGNIVGGFSMALKRLSEGPGVVVGKILSESMKSHSSPEGRRDNLDGYYGREIAELADGGTRELDTVGYQKATLRGRAGRLLAKRVYSLRARAMLADGRDAEAEKVLLGVLDGPKDTDAEVRYLIYELRLKQGKEAAARTNLNLAAKDPEAPPKVYTTLLEDCDAREDWGAGLKVLDRMDQRFDMHAAHLPLRLDYLLRMKQTQAAGKVAAECGASKDMATKTACKSVIDRHRAPRATARQASL